MEFETLTTIMQFSTSQHEDGPYKILFPVGPCKTVECALPEMHNIP